MIRFKLNNTPDRGWHWVPVRADGSASTAVYIPLSWEHLPEPGQASDSDLKMAVSLLDEIDDRPF